jgi:hypothetical protein
MAAAAVLQRGKPQQCPAPAPLLLLQLLTPMQMARLTVDCWPWHTTMKNLARAHKQRNALRRR